MLERVAVRQERFKTPGLRADGRGIAVGERGVLRFGTLTQLVGFFRAFSEEQSLDHILPTLRIVKVKSQIQGLEFLLDLPSQGTHMLDRAAAIARLLRGGVFTGRAPHFVRYRDPNAPFGYDARRLVSVREGVVLYDVSGPQQFKEEGEISMRGLLLSLSLVRKRDEKASGSVFIRVPVGLAESVQRFLWERRISAGVAELVREAAGRFDERETFFLFRVENFPPRLIPLFEGMPSVELYTARRTNVFVERGYQHPIALESCRKALEEEGAYFFSGSRDCVDRVEGEAAFVDIEYLKDLDLHSTLNPKREARLIAEGGAAPEGWTVKEVKAALHYPVHLIPRREASEGGTAVFINSPADMAWLKRLVYAMPETALDSYRMALTDRGCLVINTGGVEFVPVGLQMREVFSKVYIPRDMIFSPPLGYEQLKRHLGLTEGFVYVMPTGIHEAFALQEEHLHPVARYLLADIKLTLTRDIAAKKQLVEEAVELVNEDLGYFALWGHNLRKNKLVDARPSPTQPLMAISPPGMEEES